MHYANAKLAKIWDIQGEAVWRFYATFVINMITPDAMTEDKSPFLHAVAKAYVEHEPDRMLDYCFVFPNKRSATFFTDFVGRVSRENGTPLVHPACSTIVDFVESFSDSIPGDRMEMVFILYDVYREVVTTHRSAAEADTIDFNRFVFWADILLNDFDDVDTSLANPDEIFRNVETLKEISANYLTSDQIEIIRHYWDEEKVPQEVQEFWNHVAHPVGENPDAPLATSFLRLWQVMKEVYYGFQNRLESMGLHTPGMAYRKAVATLDNLDAHQLPFRRYVFVGFNNLSKAERSIFARLKDLRDDERGRSMGDFYWDLASPVFADNGFAAARHVKRYSEDFPSLYDCVAQIEDFPSIEIIGVPSRVGQAKVVGKLLDGLFPSDSPIDEQRLRNTAIVLPEESTLTPMLNSLPGHITPLNITMGYKLRNTSVAGLIRNIVSMQMRAYKSKAENCFFRDDVRSVLSHPLVRGYHPLTCTRLLAEIQQRRYFNVPEALFSCPENQELRPVFTMIANKTDGNEVFGYLDTLMRWLGEAVKCWLPEEADDDDNMTDGQIRDADPEDGEEPEDEMARVRDSQQLSRSVALQEAFLRRYANAVAKLQRLCATYLNSRHVFVEDATVFSLTERMVQGEMLNFEGVPLRGLQIMGVLEARSLDFDTLILPSMNERIFPRAKFTGSFIPMVLRSAYGLPTPDDQENAYAYFFYRMISRARKVYLLYDARSTGLKSRQMSRYIHQLTHIFKPKNMTRRVLPYHMSPPEPPAFTVEKTPQVMERLNRYRNHADMRHSLSASSIKLYAGCPMAFYFEKVMGYRREDDVTDWLDESTYGTVVHEVFEHLYGLRLKGRENKGVRITAADLDEMQKNVAEIDRQITMAINRHYHNLGDNDTTELSGDARLIGIVIRGIVKRVFEREKLHAPFVYLHGEWEATNVLTLRGNGNKTLSVNFNCRIDRVDRYEGDGTFPRMRIIDYKTGGDKTEAVSAEQIFTKYDQKAFLQLMLYCEAYAQFTGYNDAIQPMVFQLRQAMVNDIKPLKLWAPANNESTDHCDLKKPQRAAGKWNMLDYRDYAAEVNDHLIMYLEELFNPDVPFRCAEDNDPCKLCSFTSICQRESKN